MERDETPEEMEEEFVRESRVDETTRRVREAARASIRDAGNPSARAKRRKDKFTSK